MASVTALSLPAALATTVCGPNKNRFKGACLTTFKVLGSVGHADTTLKLVNTAAELAKLTHPGSQVAATLASNTKDGREVLGLLKAPTTAWAFVGAVRTFVHLATSKLNSEDPIALKAEGPWVDDVAALQKSTSENGFKGTLKNYASVAINPKEKKLALVHGALNVVQLACSTMGFGVCKSISYASKCGAVLSSTTLKVGKSMGRVMFPAHIAAFFRSLAAMILEQWTYKRETNLNQVDLTKKHHQERYTHFVKAQINHGCSGLQAACELAGDAALFTPLAPFVKASLSLSAAALGFFKTIIVIAGQ